MQRQLFRKQALERLSRPEHLDQLISVLNAKLWLPLLTLLALAAGAITWSILGRIPVNVDGPGVLVNPYQVKPIVTISAGEISQLLIHTDSVVSKGEIVAELRQPDLSQRVEHARERLTQALQQHTQQQGDDQKFAAQERDLIARQVTLLETSIAQSQQLLEQAAVGNEAYESGQQVGLETAQSLVRKLNLQLKEKQISLVGLEDQRLIPRDMRLAAEAEMIESTLRLADIDLQKTSLGLQKLQSKQLQLQQQSQVNELNLELKRLLLRVEEIQRNSSENQAARQRERLQLEQQTRELEASLERGQYLRSEFHGRVIEISSFVGQRLSPLTRIASVALTSDEADAPPVAAKQTLQCIAYLPLQAGKKISIGVPVRVTPTTVQQARFGSMVGTVTRVSEYPVSNEAAIHTLGSEQILTDLSQASALLEVAVQMQTANTESGYRWTTHSGPPVQISSGTTTLASFTIEQRAPITYVIPLLRSFIVGGGELTTVPATTMQSIGRK